MILQVFSNLNDFYSGSLEKPTKCTYLRFALHVVFQWGLFYKRLWCDVCEYHLSLLVTKPRQKYCTDLSPIQCILVYLPSVSLFPHGNCQSGSNCSALRKFTANVVAIRNVIVLPGFGTAMATHIKAAGRRTARTISLFAVETVKDTKKKCSW